MEELVKIFKALSIASLFFGMVLFFLRVYAPFKAFPFPRSALLIDYIISLFLIGKLAEKRISWVDREGKK